MFAILVAERGNNSKITSFFDAFWYTIVTVTTIGYGDITPATTAGRIIAVVIMLGGVVSFGAVSGKIASVLVERQQKRNRGFAQLKKKRDHLVLCGWKPEMESIIAGILASNPDMTPSDIVLVTGAPEAVLFPVLSNRQFQGIMYGNGDFTEEETLTRANIERADKVLVLSDYSRDYSLMEMDSRTVLAVLVIKKLNRTCYVVAELLDEKFKKHLESEHCDEIILSRHYEQKLLASASSGTGMSHVLNSMFGDRHGLSVIPVPKEFIMRPFEELCAHFDRTGAGIVIGLLENTGNYFLRKQEALSEAQKNPDVTEVVNNLKRVKEMKSNQTVLAPEKSIQSRNIRG